MQTARYTQFSGLLNIGTTDFNKQANELSACKNCYEYEIGKLEKVPGYTKGADTVVVSDKDVRFLHYYSFSGGFEGSTGLIFTNNYLIAACNDGSGNTILKYIADQESAVPQTLKNFTTIQTITGFIDVNLSAADYLGKVFVVGAQESILSGVPITPFTIAGQYSISTLTYSTADSDLPDDIVGKYIIRYRDLLYILNCREGDHITGSHYPSRAYYCNAPIAGAITWDSDTNFIEFGFEDGDEITGAVEALDRLLVFKRFSVWLYDEDVRRKIADIGCDSYKSIISIEGIPYWFNRSGVYRWGGNQPQLISAKVQEFIDSIDQTTLHTLSAIRHEFEYRLFIGDVTVRGMTYVNCWICFDTKREIWYIRSTYHKAISCSLYVHEYKKRSYFGSDNGWVYKFAIKTDNIYADDDNEIDSFFITNNLDFGVPEIKKYNTQLTVFSKNPQAMVLSIDADNKDTFNIARGSVLTRNVENINVNGEGHRFRYKFTEKSKNQSWQFEGFTVDVDIKEKEI